MNVSEQGGRFRLCTVLPQFANHARTPNLRDTSDDFPETQSDALFVPSGEALTLSLCQCSVFIFHIICALIFIEHVNVV